MSGVKESDKGALYLALEMIRNVQDSLSTEDAAVVDSHVNDLESLLGVSTSNADDFKNYSYFPSSLSDVLAASTNTNLSSAPPSGGGGGGGGGGAVVVNATDDRLLPYNKSLDRAQSQPAFQSFVDLVSQKGFFNGVEPDSVEYFQRNAKLIAKFSQKVKAESANQEQQEKAREEEERLAREKEAEEEKEAGNAALCVKDYDGAIHHYTSAIDLAESSPNTHIYYSNRAAAYFQKKEYTDAMQDCEHAINLVPSYFKAHYRLGQTYDKLNDYEKAVKAYSMAVELDPNNAPYKESLTKAQNNFKEQQKKPKAAAGNSAVNPANLEGLMNPALLNNPMLQNMMKGMGGMEGIQNMMKEPKAQQMMQEMMSNPQMMQQAMSMMGNLGLK